MRGMLLQPQPAGFKSAVIDFALVAKASASGIDAVVRRRFSANVCFLRSIFGMLPSDSAT